MTTRDYFFCFFIVPRAFAFAMVSRASVEGRRSIARWNARRRARASESERARVRDARTTMSIDPSAAAVIKRLKDVAAGDAHAFASMTVRRARCVTRKSARGTAGTARARPRRTARRYRLTETRTRRSTQLEQARERLDRSREISVTIEASLRAETARKRALVEVFVRDGVARPPAPAEDARSAAVDASMGLDVDVEDGDLNDLEACKAALARSQARARVSLARARRARAHNEALEAALAARGIEAP